MTRTPNTSPTVSHGNCLDVLKAVEDNTYAAVVTDPPYGLTDIPAAKTVEALTKWVSGDRGFVPEGAGFMQRRWDKFVPPPALWDEVFRTLKPGGHAFVFAGARTVDLMGMSLRLAGFEIRDTISWIRSDGMPKGQELSKAMTRKGVPAETAEQWKDFHSALKPAVEPIIVARKPLDGTLIENAIEHGVGVLNIGACRVPANNRPLRESRPNGKDSKVFRNGKGSVAVGTTDTGRFPPNVILDESAAQALDEQTGVLTSGKPAAGGHARNTPSGEGIFGGGKGMWTEAGDAGTLYGDSGGASRFFYCAKAPKRERPEVDGTWHVSVKPLALMRWIARLAAPRGSIILDPFAGSGTTGEACLLEGQRVHMIEADPKHIPLIEARLQRARAS